MKPCEIASNSGNSNASHAFASRTLAEWKQRLAAVTGVWAPVQTAHELHADAQVPTAGGDAALAQDVELQGSARPDLRGRDAAGAVAGVEVSERRDAVEPAPGRPRRARVVADDVEDDVVIRWKEPDARGAEGEVGEKEGVVGDKQVGVFHPPACVLIEAGFVRRAALAHAVARVALHVLPDARPRERGERGERAVLRFFEPLSDDVERAHLLRLAEELVLWSSQEFGFIELPDAYCTGSSMMPQKKNPDVPELIRGKSGRVFGHLFALLTIMKGLPLAYNRDLQEDKVPLFDTVDTVETSLGIMREVIAGLKARAERMMTAVSDGYMNATDVADYLAERGVPFRSAHEIAGKVVQYGIAQNKRIEEFSLAELKRFSETFGADLYEYIAPAAMIRRRRALGGTARSNVVRRLKELGI